MGWPKKPAWSNNRDGATGVFRLALVVLVVIPGCIWLHYDPGPLDRFDAVITDAVVSLRAGWLDTLARNLDSDQLVSIRCRYLVGCDGGRSTVRRGSGAELTGIAEYQRVQSTYFRAPKLKSLLHGEPAWMYLAFNPRRCGTMMAIDGKETWLIHNFL